MVVNVDAGYVAVPAPAGGGSTLCASDAVEQVTLPAAPASGSDRIDLITCHARGTDLDGGVNNDFIFTSVQGDVAPPPAPVPATPPGMVALARVQVVGGSAAVDAPHITDVRPPSLAVQPPDAPPKYPPWPRENHAITYGASGAPNPAYPVKQVSGRAQLTTDAAGRTNLPMNYGNAGIVPDANLIVAFHAMSIGICLQISNDTPYPWPDPKNIPLRCFSVLGAAYQGTFNIIYTLVFQNGAA